MSHTKGPWRLDQDLRVEEGGVLDDHYHLVEAGDGFQDEESKGFRIHGVMSVHDARLIAAAPELLETLEAVYKLCMLDIPLWDRMADVIRKAKGGAA